MALISSFAFAQENSPLTPDTPYSVRFAGDSMLFSNLSQLKKGVGIPLNPGGVFGISVNKSVQVGFQLRF